MTKFGVVQMNSGAIAEDNLDVLEGQLKQLRAQGARLVVTPENTLVFGKKEDYERYAEDLGHGPLQKKLSQLAFELGIWLVIGSFPIRNNDGTLSTTCLVYDAAGNLRASYEKLHMFDVDIADNHRSYRESDTFKAGENMALVDTPFGTLGLSICYDIRFPQLYAALRQRGADIIVVPAAFTKVTGSAHWEVLLRARAIETQCWVLASAQCGAHEGGRETYGHSMIIDPWGQVACTLNDHIGTAWADIDLATNSAIRSKMPVLQHARLQCAMK
ncbi:carbon-nitrogen hydrolase family protein [Enterovibrio sp. ZSDZ35]|uniref:Carbon-nitrogen hydrolase family protein n=1 Tax=Enterovibrio qingdaonensis TaxID=2899818 RepID=A0ABT5QMJ4_9GAMM|nr:carbon-nitrogen hydrolase family protein [Enterovibrio sp. ZSDZ35]MDD1782215.1 carbon-nitrogen hydrolase family protein [Enterovibrio sp. ZSDZ35]